MKFLQLFIVALLSFTLVNSKSYRNYKVVTFKIENEEQLKEVQTLQMQPGFTFWDPPEQVNMKIDLVIQPDLLPMFDEIARLTNIDYEVTSNDLQEWFDAEKPLKTRKEFAMDKYNELHEINQFMDEMVRLYPNKASIFTIGESFEGRIIRGMKISTNENNPGIFLEASIHAREWISSATATWIIQEVLSNEHLPEFKETADSVTWYILPVLNVDGFAYTHEEDRLWRKTRSIHNLLCRGADPNRNFGWNWRMGGSSTLACTDTYSGPAPFSEKETKALTDFYATVSDKMEAYICFHSAAQMLMYPLGNTTDTELVPNYDDLHAIAGAAVDALIAVYGTQYLWGNAMETLYVTSGSSRDHFYGHFHTPLVFTYEMRQGVGTPSRFILPADEIHPNSVEVFTSLITLIEKAKELGYFKLLNQ